MATDPRGFHASPRERALARLVGQVLLLAVVYAAVGGHDRLTTLLRADVLCADGAAAAGRATVLASLGVHALAAALWVPVAVAARRVGVRPATLAVVLATTVAVVLTRVAVEVGTGTLLTGFPALAIAATVLVVAAVGERRPRPLRRRNRLRAKADRGLAMLRGASPAARSRDTA